MTEKPRARCAPAVYLFIALLGAVVGPRTGCADPPGVIDSDSIIRSLSSPGTTTRGFEVEARTNPGPPSAGSSGTVSLDIRFANDSNQLTAAAHAQLSQLGAALNAPALSHTRFLIAGHTSATGDARHNQQLSESRARSVRAYLLEHFSIAPARLEATGFGASHPLSQYAPTALQQRRVEISTLPTAP